MGDIGKPRREIVIPIPKPADVPEPVVAPEPVHEPVPA